jgi:hypothetical protein
LLKYFVFFDFAIVFKHLSRVVKHEKLATQVTHLLILDLVDSTSRLLAQSFVGERKQLWIRDPAGVQELPSFLGNLISIDDLREGHDGLLGFECGLLLFQRFLELFVLCKVLQVALIVAISIPALNLRLPWPETSDRVSEQLVM